MKSRKYRLLMTISMLLISTAFSEEPADRFQVVVDRLVKSINEKDYAGIQQDFDKVMLDALPPEKLKPFFAGISAQYGKIIKLDAPRMTASYQATFLAHFQRGILDIQLALNDENKIIGLMFVPPSASVHAQEENQTVLKLPFKKQWTVFWGGDTKELNAHHDTPNQKYAFDFVIKDPKGKTYRNQGLSNEDYYAFGQEILAPSDGVVTDVIRGVRDNKPGSMNPYSALGNAVVIMHQDNEFSVLAHFKQNSIRVKEGDAVKQGQVLGLCGNSGNSSEAHLHYHLQNTEIIQDGMGIKCFFDRVRVKHNGKNVVQKRHAPVKDEIVKQL